jgi:hypothetical protein
MARRKRNIIAHKESKRRNLQGQSGGHHIQCPRGQMWNGSQCVQAFINCTCPTNIEYYTDYEGSWPMWNYDGECCETDSDCNQCPDLNDYDYLGNEGTSCIEAMTVEYPMWQEWIGGSDITMMEYFNDDIDCSQSDICCDVNNPANCHHCECNLFGSPIFCRYAPFTGGVGCCAEFLDSDS